MPVTSRGVNRVTAEGSLDLHTMRGKLPDFRLVADRYLVLRLRGDVCLAVRSGLVLVHPRGP